jgi:hypothetical protein
MSCLVGKDIVQCIFDRGLTHSHSDHWTWTSAAAAQRRRRRMARCCCGYGCCSPPNVFLYEIADVEQLPRKFDDDKSGLIGERRRLVSVVVVVGSSSGGASIDGFI